MTIMQSGTRITLKNILYLTDFSDASGAALPFAISLGRSYDASVHALHVLTPPIPEACRDAIHADEDLANAEMVKVGWQLAGLEHDMGLVHGAALWSALEPVIKHHSIDLIVLGTHGRTGLQKLLLGSFAEEIFRRSTVPVLTVGPHVPKSTRADGRFRSVLFATDFSASSLIAAPFAISIAEENDAELVLLTVMSQSDMKHQAVAVAHLNELVPSDSRIRSQETFAVVRYGEIAGRILDTAAEHWTDIIVLGVRDASKHLGAATHLERATAHRVVAHAPCPVLTVRA